MAMTRRAKQWSRILGVSPEQIEAGYTATSEDAAEIVRSQADRVVKEIQNGSRSLIGYEAVKEQLPDRQGKTININGEKIFIPAWRVYVKPSPQHERIVDNGFPLNVFDLLDTGRKALPQKAPGRAYLLWGWSGKTNDPQLKVPAKSTRNKKGQFGYTQPRERSADARKAYPNRPEPRSNSQGGNHNAAVAGVMQQVPYSARNKNRTGSPRYKKAKGEGAVSPKKGSRFALKPGIRLFSAGPLTRIPPRNLYDRILRTSKDRLKGAGFTEWEVIFVGKGKK